MKQLTAFLVPQFDLLVRNPFDGMTFIPKVGAELSLVGKEGRYWRRRILDGSLKIIEPKTTRRKQK